MSTSYDAFLPEVMPYLHGCAEPLAFNAIRNAVIEFCEQSLVYLHTPADISVTGGTSTYALTLPAQTRLAMIYSSWFEGRPIQFRSADALGQLYGRDWRAISSAPRYITFDDPNSLILAPTPDQDSVDGLGLIVALTPTRASTGVDDMIYERWLEPIAFGARSRLHALAGQPFSDPTQAGFERAMFLSGAAKAAASRNRAFTRAQVVARPQTPW